MTVLYLLFETQNPSIFQESPFKTETPSPVTNTPKNKNAQLNKIQQNPKPQNQFPLSQQIQ